MAKFFTRKGDEGFTGLLGDERVPKYHPRTTTIGDLDEATASIGVARAFVKHSQSPQILIQVQRDLYGVMAEVAATPQNASRFRKINAENVSWLETWIETLGSQVTLPNEFIIPGDSTPGAFLSLSRSIVRRAERQITILFHSKEIENIYLLHYLNRLSSLLFVLELLEIYFTDKSSPTLAKG